MIAQSRIESDGTLVITVLAETLDRTNAAEFKEEAAQAVANAKGAVVVECSHLEFIDSSGLGAFLHLHNLLPENQRPVRLSNVGMKILTLLELMQVHRIFDLEPGK